MVFVSNGMLVKYPLSVDEQNIEIECALLESEVNHATLRKPLSIPESIFEFWEQYYSKHPECV